MSKVKAPFLSLGATGKLAGTLVASTWKGLKTMRSLVPPSNPNTAAQQTSRSNFQTSLYAFRNYLTNAIARTAWNLAATRATTPLSGYNAVMQSMLSDLVSIPAPSYVVSCAAGAALDAVFTLLDVSDGTTGDEAGNFQVFAGLSPSSMLLIETKTIAAGLVTTSALGDADDVMYVQLKKADVARSGIHKVTLVAAPSFDYVVTGTLAPDVTGNFDENGTYAGKAAYERTPSGAWIYWDTDVGVWRIWTTKLSFPGGNTWFDGTFAAGSTPTIGTYDPLGPNTGVATVAAG